MHTAQPLYQESRWVIESRKNEGGNSCDTLIFSASVSFSPAIKLFRFCPHVDRRNLHILHYYWILCENCNIFWGIKCNLLFETWADCIVGMIQRDKEKGRGGRKEACKKISQLQVHRWPDRLEERAFQLFRTLSLYTYSTLHWLPAMARSAIS